MKADKAILTYRRMRTQPLWSLLASDQGPTVLGLLQTHLYETERSLPASILHERISRDLEDLRGHGETFPLTAQAYIARWLSEVRRHQGVLENCSALLRDLERQHREAGGDQIEQWELEKGSLETQRGERLRKRDQAATACRELGWPLPGNPGDFAEVLGRARREVEEWQTDDTLQDELLRLSQEKSEAEKVRKEAGQEVSALRRQPSNIPAQMLELRRDIAAAIGVAEGALPFVGELLQVKPEEGPWNGAIERVLHGFALSLLVDERHYIALAGHINRVNLGRRLVYYRTGAIEAQQAKPVSQNSLVLKLNVKPGAWSPWLLAELRQWFDYACVDRCRHSEAPSAL